MQKAVNKQTQKRVLALIWVFFFALATGARAWRSQLYPEDWTPGYALDGGLTLQDFSYAGYRYGVEPIPEGYEDRLVDVTAAPYKADNTGKKSATKAIQQAIDDVGKAGGGTVYLPEGSYKLTYQKRRSYALSITDNNVILKGAGVGKTYLFSSQRVSRKKQIISVGSAADAFDKPSDGVTHLLAADTPDQALSVALGSTEGLSVGDWVIVRCDRSEDFIKSVGMKKFWKKSTTDGLSFIRRITQIDDQARSVTLDIPLRYPLLTRDNARLYRCEMTATGVGLQDFSIGGKIYGKAGASGWGADDYKKSGTAAHNVHEAMLIRLRCAADCWVKNISSYRPSVNRRDLHMPSGGLDLHNCRSVTVDNCHFAKTQYKGGGGNGYGITVSSGDCLIANCSATGMRHGFSFKSGSANGNVVYAFTATDNRYACDFHMFLSVSNLIDSLRCVNDGLRATVRDDGEKKARHGQTTSQSVFWNTVGAGSQYTSEGNLVISRQLGMGYVIGVSGDGKVLTAPTLMTFGQNLGRVETAPEDYTEGIGKGASLEPQSLYLDQLEKRTGAPSVQIIPPPAFDAAKALAEANAELADGDGQDGGADDPDDGADEAETDEDALETDEDAPETDEDAPDSDEDA